MSTPQHLITSTHPAWGPATIADCRAYVAGEKPKQIAARTGRSIHTVHQSLKQGREHLRRQGHVGADDPGTLIGLRRAMRNLGLLEGIELL